MNKPFVAILMGSQSDLTIMEGAADVFDKLQISYEIKITSAHRTPANTQHYIADAEARGCQVFISGAGLAAHLAGATAAHTLKPVIGVPIDSGPLQGMDSLLSTVQMPAGIPVATVAIGKTGAKNAAYLAAQILALSDPGLAQRVKEEREQKARDVQAQDAALQEARRKN
jgi:5-(carboxyamino)imidazole ribonucleotide mutase